MRRLFLWTFSSVISLVVIVLAIIGASRKSDMQLALVSTNPDGTPCEEICLFGAQPEKMNYAQIQGLLMQHPFLRGLHLESRPNTYDYFFGQTVNVNHVEGLVSIQFHAPTHCTDLYPECYVKPNNVLVQSLRENLRLSSIIKDFGEPDFVELQTGDQGISLISLWEVEETVEYGRFSGRGALWALAFSYGAVSPFAAFSLSWRIPAAACGLDAAHRSAAPCRIAWYALPVDQR